MKILVLGSGGREHAIAWKLSKSRKVRRVFAGPGNAGMEDVCQNLPAVDPMKFESVLVAARKHGIDCVFVGPEVPLAAGVVDYLSEQGIIAIGPDSKAARLESSKTFSKAFLMKHGIPTGSAVEFRDPAPFEEHVRKNSGRRLVVKKSGLAAGKGVLESSDPGTLIDFGRSILSSDGLLVEEFLSGWEVSIFGLSDGKTHVILPPCTDFKKAHDGDTGPNTGGMGSICPVPRVDASLMQRITRDVVQPTYLAMRKEGLSYRGILYFGIMVTADGPKVLEFNVRFGDPETQVLLPSMDADLGEIVEAMARGKLAGYADGGGSPLHAAARAVVGTPGAHSAPDVLRAARASGGTPGAHGAPAVLRAARAALGVVIAGKGYPESAVKGVAARVEPQSADGNAPGAASDALIFHAGTSRDGSGTLRVGGGRCFTVVGTGKDLSEARAKAYAAVPRVQFDGGWCRSDIGLKFLGEGE